MEQNKLIGNTSQQLTNSLKQTDLITVAEKGVSLSAASGTDRTEALQYIMALLGIPKDRRPSAPEFGMILNYLKTHFSNFTVAELKLSFDLAVKKSFPVNLELYGGTLSVKFISDVLNAYNEFKKSEKKKAEVKLPSDSMNNYERTARIMDLLTPKLKDELKEIGKPHPKPNLSGIQLPYHDIHQKWLKEFDKLRRRWPGRFFNKETNQWHENDRFIIRYGETMDIHRYFEIKADQLQMVKERKQNK